MNRRSFRRKQRCENGLLVSRSRPDQPEEVKARVRKALKEMGFNLWMPEPEKPRARGVGRRN